MKRSAPLVLLMALRCSPPMAIDRLGADEATAREAIAGFAGRGETALPELRSAASHDDPLVRRVRRSEVRR